MGLGRADAVYMRVIARPRRHPRRGLIDRYLLRGVAGPFVGVLLAVTAALSLERALRLIHEMAATGADFSYFLPLLVQLLPYYLDLAIPLAFMVALVLLVARLDQRLELEAMLASGLSMARIAAPLVALGMILSGFALLAGGWLEPLGRYGFRSLRIEAVNAGQLTGLQPRAVFQSGDDLAVTFDARAPDGSIGRVFLWQRLDNGEELVVSGETARAGFSREGRLFGIDFASGRYVAGRPGADPTSLDFARLAIRKPLQPRDASWERGWDQKELTLLELAKEMRSGTRGLSHRAVEAEFYGRIARALIIPFVPLLVLPLAFATKKRGRSLGVLLCGAFLVLANHGLSFAKNLALLGGAPPLVVIPAALALVGCAAVALFVSARTLPSHSPVHSVLNRIAAAAARLTSKAGGATGSGGRSLGVYVAWQLGKWTLVILATVAAFLQMIDLVDQGDEFFERGMGLREIGRYAMLRLPATIQQAVPIASLGGAMAAFALFAGAREMTAMRAVGVSQWRVLVMAAPVSLALLAATFVLAEWVTPASQLRLATWWSAMEPAQQEQAKRARWFRIEDAIVRAGAASANGDTLRDVQIFVRDDNGRLVRRLAAERAVFSRGRWWLADAEITRFDADGSQRTHSKSLVWPASLQPRDVTAFFAASPALSAAAARRSLDNAAPVNRGEMLFATRVHRSVAEPLAPLVMLLLALPLAFIPPRTGRSWPALLYAGAGGLIYLVADGVLTVAAQVGYVPPVLGAWTAPVLGILIGLNVLLYVER
jgi:lipopolysaccharide export system permease protein